MEVLADVILSHVIGDLFAVFVGFDDVLSTFGFVHGALAAFARPGDVHFLFAFIGGLNRHGESEQKQPRDSRE